MTFHLSRTLYGKVKFGPLNDFVPSFKLNPVDNTFSNEKIKLSKNEKIELSVDAVIEGKALEQLKERHIWAIENGYQY